MSHSHLPDPRNRVDMVIREGTTWEWVALLDFGGLHLPQPDLSTYTGTYTVFPDLNTEDEPVICLGTSAGMSVTYNTGEATKLTTTGVTLGLFGYDEIETKLDSGAGKGDGVLTLDDATGVAAGRHIAVWLDTGEIHISSVASVDGSDVTLTTPLSGDAASANVVKHWDGEWMLCNVLLSLSSTATKALTPWGQGLYQIDIIDDFGHVLPLDISGICCLERGGGHE